MDTLEGKINKFTATVEYLKDAPPNEETQQIKKRVSDIRDLMIKADVLMETGRNPSFIFDRIEQLLDTIRIPNKKDNGKT